MRLCGSKPFREVLCFASIAEESGSIAEACAEASVANTHFVSIAEQSEALRKMLRKHFMYRQFTCIAEESGSWRKRKAEAQQIIGLLYCSALCAT